MNQLNSPTNKKNNYHKFEYIRGYMSKKKPAYRVNRTFRNQIYSEKVQNKFNTSIINSDCLFEIYEEILRKHSGIFEVNLKFPVRDIFALNLVYTPGVAAPCLDIQKDLLKSYAFTNRLNSMLLITDCSKFEKENWNDSAAMPFLEAFCVYYKSLVNIDCYPIIMDSSLVKYSEEFAETVYAISASFSAVEFFGVAENIVADFRKIYNNKKPNENTFCWIDASDKKSLYQRFGMDITFAYAAILRVLLDAQVYIDANTILEKIIIRFFLNEQDKKIFENVNLYKKTNIVLRETTRIIFDKLINIENYTEGDKYMESINNGSKIGFHYTKYYSFNKSEHNINNFELSEKYIQCKYEKFLLEGEHSWVNVLPNDYSPEKNTNDINALILHWRYKGVIQTNSKIHIREINHLEKLFCFDNLEKISEIIKKNPDEAFNLTCKSNLGAIITNGTAILGLGDIGAVAGQPVMEGKSVLFKLYGGTDIIPICIQEKDEEKLIKIIQRIGSGLSIINLEDIKAPQCFKVERELNQRFDFPVFHDDQHGTAVVTLAGLINAVKLKKIEDKSSIRIIMNGAGAAGLSVTELLISYGFTNFIICDTEGAIYKGRPNNMNDFKNKLAEMTNKKCEQGKLIDIIKNADVFIGLSVAGALTQDMIKTMAKNPIIFALANPKPEIYPKEALEAGAFIVATGRSDFPNQINNSLAFPGIFRAAIDTKAKNITTEMKVAAAVGIANLVDDDELRPDYIMPGSLDTGVSINVTKAVSEVAIKNGEARKTDINSDLIEENIYSWFLEGRLINPDYIKEMNLKF